MAPNNVFEGGTKFFEGGPNFSMGDQFFRKIWSGGTIFFEKFGPGGPFFSKNLVRGEQFWGDQIFRDTGRKKLRVCKKQIQAHKRKGGFEGCKQHCHAELYCSSSAREKKWP